MLPMKRVHIDTTSTAPNDLRRHALSNHLSISVVDELVILVFSIVRLQTCSTERFLSSMVGDTDERTIRRWRRSQPLVIVEAKPTSLKCPHESPLQPPCLDQDDRILNYRASQCLLPCAQESIHSRRPDEAIKYVKSYPCSPTVCIRVYLQRLYRRING